MLQTTVFTLMGSGKDWTNAIRICGIKTVVSEPYRIINSLHCFKLSTYSRHALALKFVQMQTRLLKFVSESMSKDGERLQQSGWHTIKK